MSMASKGVSRCPMRVDSRRQSPSRPPPFWLRQCNEGGPALISVPEGASHLRRVPLWAAAHHTTQRAAAHDIARSRLFVQGPRHSQGSPQKSSHCTCSPGACSRAAPPTCEAQRLRWSASRYALALCPLPLTRELPQGGATSPVHLSQLLR